MCVCVCVCVCVYVCVCVGGGLLKLSLFRGRGFRICRLVTDRDEEHPTDTYLSLYTHLSFFSLKKCSFFLELDAQVVSCILSSCSSQIFSLKLFLVYRTLGIVGITVLISVHGPVIFVLFDKRVSQL